MKIDLEEFTNVWNDKLNPQEVAEHYGLAVSTVTGYASVCRARGLPCLSLRKSVFPEELFVKYWQEANSIYELQLNLRRDGWYDEAKNLISRAHRLRLKGLNLKKMPTGPSQKKQVTVYVQP